MKITSLSFEVGGRGKVWIQSLPPQTPLVTCEITLCMLL